MKATSYLEQILSSKTAFDQNGKERLVTGGVSSKEARFITSLIKANNLTICLETGVAYGVSTLAICSALSDLRDAGSSCKLFGADPCQFTDYDGTALESLRRTGLSGLFELLEGPSHLMLPQLIERGIKVDFAFIDAWHTFDYTLIDVFLADKLLRPGGFLLMHDYVMPSKKKVWRYLLSHRKYTPIPGPTLSIARQCLSAGKQATMLKPRLAFQKLFTRTNLAVARKDEDFEPDYSFFKRF